MAPLNQPADEVRARGMAPGTIPRDSCPLCGSASPRRYLSLRDRLLLECRSCRVRFTDVLGSRDAIGSYYSKVLAHDGKIEASGGDAKLRAIARSQADAIEEFCGPRRYGRFLELGCARGHLLEEMEGRGWDVVGVDVSEPGIEESRSRVRGPVHLGEVGEIGLEEAGFHRVAMFDILAHLADPVATLTEVARLLKPGGFLVLSTVNEGWRLTGAFRTLFRLFPKATVDLRDEMYEGQHYCYFSEDNVGQLMERAGLELLEVMPLEPLSARYFIHQYSWARRMALLTMVRLDQVLGNGRKMLVLARRRKEAEADRRS